VTRCFDVAVVGLGAMGAAALCHLARAGLSVVGIERFASPHANGSSHGGSRIIREAYFEDPCYVPLVQRAYELWASLERDSARRLLIPSGGVMIGPPEGALVRGALRSAREHGLSHELLEPAEITRRFPAFRPAAGMVGVFEPRAGVLLPEACISAHLERAARAGAEIRPHTRVLDWSATQDRVRIRTDAGDVQAGQVLLAAGAWLPGLLHGLALPLAVERVVQAWFEPAGDAALLAPARCPLTIWEYGAGQHFYALPALDGKLKAALHHQGEPADPDDLRREVTEAEVARIREPLGRHIPPAAGRSAGALACLYTNTPDEHFAIDRHPAEPRAIVVSACSGHGFKFASAIGEAVARMVKDGAPAPVPERFGLARFAARARN
jgi:sarcosine oxidase